MEQKLKENPNWKPKWVGKKKITLPWMDKIRERMVEVGHSGFSGGIVLPDEVTEFITPIMDYGKLEEERLNVAFRKEYECPHLDTRCSDILHKNKEDKNGNKTTL